MSSTSRRPLGSTNTSSSISSAAAVAASSSSSSSLPRPNLTLGSQLTIPSDVCLAGSITLGAGVVLHPTCSIHSLQPEGSVVLGPGCLVSEHVKVINTLPREMKIGKGTILESGAFLRDVIEVGEKCTFEVRCSVSGPGWRCGDAVVVGAGVKVGANASSAAGGPAVRTKDQRAKEQRRLGALLDLNIDGNENQPASAPPPPPRIQVTEEGSSTDTVLAPDQLVHTRQQPEDDYGEDEDEDDDDDEDEETIHIPSHTVFFSTSSTRTGTGIGSSATLGSRLASEEMAVQNEALYVKHMDYLRQVLPKAHKLKALV